MFGAASMEVGFDQGAGSDSNHVHAGVSLSGMQSISADWQESAM